MVCSARKVPSKWKSMKIIFYVLIPQRLFIFVINNRDSFILLFPYVLFFLFANFHSPCIYLKGFFLSCQVSLSFVECVWAGTCATILLWHKPKWHRKYLMERQIEVKIEIKPLDKMNWKLQRLKIWSLCFDDNLLLIPCIRWFWSWNFSIGS